MNPQFAGRQLRLLTGLAVVLIFTSRLALGSVPLALPVSVMMVGWGLSKGLLMVDRSRAVLGLAALAAVMLAIGASYPLNGRGELLTPSARSVLYLVAIYLPLSTRLSGTTSAQVISGLLNRVRTMCAVVGALAVGQLLIQIVGIKDTDPLGAILPSGLLVQGYNTVYPLYYGSSLLKSNGIVCLEPSFCSQILAAGILIYLATGSRGRGLWLCSAGLAATTAGTGMLFLAVGLMTIAFSRPNRLARLVPPLLLTVGTVSLTPLANAVGKRLTEGTGDNSSTGQRFVQPFTVLGRGWLEHPYEMILGHGPGTTKTFLFKALGPVNGGSVVPLAPLKLLFEYGLPAALLVLAFVMWSVIPDTPVPPVTTGLIFSWIFLSGALLQPTTVLFMWLIAGACPVSRLVKQPQVQPFGEIAHHR